jgi:hypothetical protein
MAVMPNKSIGNETYAVISKLTPRKIQFSHRSIRLQCRLNEVHGHHRPAKQHGNQAVEAVVYSAVEQKESFQAQTMRRMVKSATVRLCERGKTVARILLVDQNLSDKSRRIAPCKKVT